MTGMRFSGGRLLPAAIFLFLAFALAMASAEAPRAVAQAAPDINELPPGPGREEVFYACYACHSFRIITQQRLPESTWDELMDWMVEKQGMPPLSPQDRKLIVSYLAKHFSPTTPR
jgi:hypothetical protein